MKDKIILSKENIETLAELVKPYLTEKRYEHTLSVKREAERLGEIFLPDEVNRLAASALFHDITKKADAKKAAWKLVDIPDLVPVPEIGAGLRIGIEDLNDDYDYTRNETYTIYVPVEVDGRQVAKATAKYTKEEIEQQQKSDLRKKGMR